MVKQSTVQLKREFDTFAANVARLEQLRHELALLPTDGFEADVARIKVRLKDITAISFIEKSIRDLRAKIEQHAHTSQQKVIGSTVVSSLKRRVGDMEALLKEKRGLSKTDASALKEVPQLERQLLRLRTQVDTHLKAKKRHIDSGVGVLVDSTFDEFVSRIKGELSERLRATEGSMGAQMQADLASREELFAQRYQTLVQELEQKYRTQLEHAMQSEVKHHLAEEVKKRIAHERTKLVALLLREQAERLVRERKQLIGKLEDSYAQREQSLISEHHRVLSRAQEGIATHRAQLTERMHRVEHQASALGKQRAELAHRALQEKKHLKQEEQRLAVCKREAEQKAQRQAKTQIKAAHDRLVGEADALRHTLALQQSHITTHLEALHAREQSLRQQEEHAKMHIAHERAVLEQSFERLQAHERMLTDKTQHQYVHKKVALTASLRRERAKLHDKQADLVARERLLASALAQERARSKTLAEKLRTELQTVTARVAEHASASKQQLAETNKRVRRKYADQYRQLAQQARVRAKEKLRMLTASLAHHKKQLAVAFALVHKREQNLKAHDVLLRQSVTREKQTLQKQFSQLVVHERTVQAEAQKTLGQRVAHQRVEDMLHYRKQLALERTKMQQELRARVLALQKNVSAEVAHKVALRESALRASLERDYKEHVRAVLARKQAQLDAKKVLLEKQVLAQAKRLFH